MIRNAPNGRCARWHAWFVFWLALAVAPVGLTREAPPPEVGSGRTSRAVVEGAHTMVAVAHPLAAAAADRILAQGGTAVDAAIAAQMVLNVVEPQSSGLGGGGFLLAYAADTDRLRVFDGRETAPAAMTSTAFLDENGKRLRFFDAVDSGLSVGVPGLVRMLDVAHRAAGRLPWARLFDDAIAIAERGFEVSPRLHLSIVAARDRIRAQPAAAAWLLDDNGEAWPVGHPLANPELAKTMRTLAEQGPDAFYSGPLAAAIVESVRSHPLRPGTMVVEDLARYKALERDPLCGVYRGLRVCGMPPPSSGALTLLQTLGILERFELGRMPPESVHAVHLVSEAYRLAYADRASFIADPAFVDVPVAGLLAEDYLTGRAALISPDRTLGSAPAGQPDGAPRAGRDDRVSMTGTTHLSIVDGEGNAVALTSSIEHAFGSLQMAGGFLLNNQLTDFSFTPADDEGRPIANRVEPGKRPRSSMAPTMVFDERGRLEAVLGSPGGSAIIHYVCATLLAMIDWDMNIQQAIDLPHFGAATSAQTTLEADTSIVELAVPLGERGHDVRARPMTSGLHGIVAGRRPDGSTGRFVRADTNARWQGGADPRREGVVIAR